MSQAKIKVHACGCYGGAPLFLNKTGIVSYKSNLRQCKKFKKKLTYNYYFVQCATTIVDDGF